MISVIVGGALVFLVIGIVTDLLISYAILRLKNLWSPQNFFLAAWVVPDVMKQFIKIYYVIYEDYNSFIGEMIGCLHLSVTIACGIAMMAILLDWYLVNYFPERLETLRGRWKAVLAVVVVVPLLTYADDVLSLVVEDSDSHFSIASLMSMMVLCSVASLIGQVLVLFGNASKVYQDSYMLVATGLFAVPFAIRWTIYLAYSQLFKNYRCFETMLFACQYCTLLRNIVIFTHDRPLYEAVRSCIKCKSVVNTSGEDAVASIEFANPSYVSHWNSENKGIA